MESPLNVNHGLFMNQYFFSSLEPVGAKFLRGHTYIANVLFLLS